jgi:hypothetical protein
MCRCCCSFSGDDYGFYVMYDYAHAVHGAEVNKCLLCTAAAAAGAAHSTAECVQPHFVAPHFRKIQLQYTIPLSPLKDALCRLIRSKGESERERWKLCSQGEKSFMIVGWQNMFIY